MSQYDLATCSTCKAPCPEGWTRCHKDEAEYHRTYRVIAAAQQARILRTAGIETLRSRAVEMFDGLGSAQLTGRSAAELVRGLKVGE